MPQSSRHSTPTPQSTKQSESRSVQANSQDPVQPISQTALRAQSADPPSPSCPEHLAPDAHTMSQPEQSTEQSAVHSQLSVQFVGPVVVALLVALFAGLLVALFAGLLVALFVRPLVALFGALFVRPLVALFERLLEPLFVGRLVVAPLAGSTASSARNTLQPWRNTTKMSHNRTIPP